MGNSKMAEFYKKCLQCPRKCGVDRTNAADGFCRENAELRIAFAGLHFGEEPLVTVFVEAEPYFLQAVPCAVPSARTIRLVRMDLGG